MRRAIGNAIRSATHEMRRLEYQRRIKLNELQNDEGMDPDKRDERIQNGKDTMEMALNENDAAEYEQDEDDVEDDDDDEIEHLNIDENIDNEDDESALQKHFIKTYDTCMDNK